MAISTVIGVAIIAGFYAGLVEGIGLGLVGGIGAGLRFLYLQRNFWHHYFFTTALDSLLLIGAVLLAWLVLGLGSVLLNASF